MANIRPFQIAVPESKLDRITHKLALTSLPTAYDAEDTWAHGVPLTKISELLDHWKTKFTWRDNQARLNRVLPQFITAIETEKFGTLNIHFVHQRAQGKGAGKKSIPLLFSHGWPGSFDEVSKVLPLLTKSQKEEDVVFDVVAPSLVNFGFSDGVTRAGFGFKQQAEVLNKLMLKLGYDKYNGDLADTGLPLVVQGGDIGMGISRMISLMYPEHCKACHTNFPRPMPPSGASEADKQPQTPFDKHGVTRNSWMESQGMGYWHLQRTKPQTIGYLLEDSPIGLLAWITEKLYDWSDAYAWTNDEILTWVSIYLFSTAGPAASVRIYKENAGDAVELVKKAMSQHIPDVLLGISRFHMEPVQPVRKEWCKNLGDLVFYNEHVVGGHFAAWEAPNELVTDLRDMFGPGGGAEGICGERSGVIKQ
ncbi:MAG: hypothetical protein M1828_004876 [Chrysothrix sp. TS-e1954]|nr:MAG: hypothetical protein M1828_004876 [Chrysothrix sp. TS-e1954]